MQTITTIPAGTEVTLALVGAVDPSLVEEITTARRRLEQLSPEVIALLGEIRALEDRVCQVADAIDDRQDDASYQTWSRVSNATGGHQLMAAAIELVRTYPLA